VKVKREIGESIRRNVISASLCCLLIFLLTAGVVPSSSIPATKVHSRTTKADSWLVGAYYYPWYGSNKRHWNQYRHQPKLGEYNAKDEQVIRQQIDWATGHGVDFFAISWWGEGTFEDEAVKSHFLKTRLIDELSFAILYESKGRLQAEENAPIDLSDTHVRETLISDFQYLARTYWNDPHYLRINGQPVVFIYVTRGFQGEIVEAMRQLQSEMGKMGFDPYLIADQYQWEVPMDEALVKAVGYEAVTTYAMKPSPSDPDDFPDTDDFINQFAAICRQRLEEAHRAGSAFVPNVLPAYYSPGLEKQIFPRLTPGQFKKLLHDALNYTDPEAANMVMITSWNEWHEGTSIEPAKEFDTHYLDALQEALDERIPVEMSKFHLSQRLGVEQEAITLISVQSKTWIDSSLDCPQPGEVYAQVLTPGYRITLQHNTKTYEYHTDLGQKVVFCRSDPMSRLEEVWENIKRWVGQVWNRAVTFVQIRLEKLIDRLRHQSQAETERQLARLLSVLALPIVLICIVIILLTVRLMASVNKPTFLGRIIARLSRLLAVIVFILGVVMGATSGGTYGEEQSGEMGAAPGTMMGALCGFLCLGPLLAYVAFIRAVLYGAAIYGTVTGFIGLLTGMLCGASIGVIWGVEGMKQGTMLGASIGLLLLGIGGFFSGLNDIDAAFAEMD
jgi:hypothetical protein